MSLNLNNVGTSKVNCIEQVIAKYVYALSTFIYLITVKIILGLTSRPQNYSFKV